MCIKMNFVTNFKQALTCSWLLVLLGVAGTSSAGILDALNKLGGDASGALGGAREFLDPEAAFKFTHRSAADGALILEWDIEDGYYLYSDKISARSLTDTVSLGALDRPEGLMKDDPDFGRVAIFKHALAVRVPVNQATAGAAQAAIEVGYQGCAEDGICYPPIKKTIDVAINPAATAATAEPNNSVARSSAMLSADDIAADLESRSLMAIAGSFYIFGLLLAFTPCVFPMVPILSGIIVGQRQPISVKRGLSLSAIYVFAVATTYAAVGLLAGLFGHNLQASFQQPGVLIAFSLIFVALSLSMFGFYELQLPTGIQTRLDKLSRNQDGGGFAGVAVMGVLSAIIVGPCVAPPLAGALIYLGHQGSPLIGGTALFALGLGMGTPLLLVGASAGKLLPRAGRWMDIVKRIFGIMLLGVAIWFLERILPGPIVLILWAVLIVVSAIFMGALDQLDRADSGWLRLYKGLGLTLLAYGAILIVGASLGASDPLRPLKPLLAGGGAQHRSLVFAAIKGPDGLSAALAQARREGRPAMLDFYADWCVECKYLERDTFEDATVQAALANVLLLRADVTANDAADKALLKQFELFGPPAVLFFDPQGEEIRQRRVLGFMPPADFTAHLNTLL
ncbi:MAG: thiol:disulfide interchange protein DsbD [Gammaproteobacteria bacterium]|jgi:thiol:disulfide interchange protein DsbD